MQDLTEVKTERPPSAFAVGFVFAMPMEAAGVADKMTQRQTTKGDGRVFHTGMFGTHQTVIVESGVGSEQAAKAAEVLLDVFAPQQIISAGYAGGLSERLKRYSVCFPELLLRKSDNTVLDVSQSVPKSVEVPLPINGKLTLLTSDEAIIDTEQKSRYCIQTGAELVDMETFAVADVCRVRRIPFRAARIILDTAAQKFPKDILHIIQCADKGVVRLTGSVLGSVFRRPSSVFDMWTLKEHTLRASDRLAAFLAKELK